MRRHAEHLNKNRLCVKEGASFHSARLLSVRFKSFLWPWEVLERCCLDFVISYSVTEVLCKKLLCNHSLRSLFKIPMKGGSGNSWATITFVFERQA